MDIIALRRKAHTIKPVIRIGKFGITDSIILEISNQLKKKKLIKIKLLASYAKQCIRKEVSEELSKRTGSRLIELNGFNVVLYRK